jgi:hypothetical protein
LTDPLPVGSFVFAPTLHQPGERTILGKRYNQEGEAQARAVLADFARSPATAHHIATKLARHVVADDPPPSLVNRLGRAYHGSQGDLPTLYRALIEAKERGNRPPPNSAIHGTGASPCSRGWARPTTRLLPRRPTAIWWAPLWSWASRSGAPDHRRFR